MRPVLETRVIVNGVTVWVGNSVPLTMNPDGSPNTSFQQQTYTGDAHKSTKKALGHVTRILRRRIERCTSLHKDVARLVVSYVPFLVPKAEILWDCVRLCCVSRVRHPPSNVLDLDFLFGSVSACTMIWRARGAAVAEPLPFLHRRMSQEVLDFYLDVIGLRWRRRFPRSAVILRQLPVSTTR